MRIYCTLFDKNYMPKGLALYQSLMDHAQPCHLYILAMDDDSFWWLYELNLPHVTVLPLTVVESRMGLQEIRANRNWMEFCWTMASQLMWYVIRITSPEMITYLDSDLFFYSSPDPIYQEMKNASIAIVPHRFHRGNARLMVNGIYNVGWLTIRCDHVGSRCLSVWAAQCRQWCYHRNEDGKFGDQAYLDTWPYEYGPACKVIENIGAGAAPWNIASYDAKRDDNGNTYLIERYQPHMDVNTVGRGARMIFYHFHEFQHDEAGNVIRLTRHPHTREHKALIYSPYIRAIQIACQQMARARLERDNRIARMKAQGERA